MGWRTSFREQGQWVTFLEGSLLGLANSRRDPFAIGGKLQLELPTSHNRTSGESGRFHLYGKPVNRPGALTARSQTSSPPVYRALFELAGNNVTHAALNSGVEQSVLLPTKHLRRERRANDKHHSQCRYVAQVRGPRVALPDPLE
jgi:hypothetical protein